jgi:hypothetical protein
MKLAKLIMSIVGIGLITAPASLGSDIIRIFVEELRVKDLKDILKDSPLGLSDGQINKTVYLNKAVELYLDAVEKQINSLRQKENFCFNKDEGAIARSGDTFILKDCEGAEVYLLAYYPTPLNRLGMRWIMFVLDKDHELIREKYTGATNRGEMIQNLKNKIYGGATLVKESILKSLSKGTQSAQSQEDINTLEKKDINSIAKDIAENLIKDIPDPDYIQVIPTKK